MLLNWIVASNLPFNVMNSMEFRRWATYRNPSAMPATKQTITNRLKAKYQRAIPYIKRVLQSAKKLIHFTFNSWTSRQNDSFLEMNAYFLDEDWNQRTVFLGLPALLYRHTGATMAKEMAEVAEFFWC
jgi:hypothetical protein